MACDAPALEEDLHGSLRDAHLHLLLFDDLVGDRVVVPFHLDVIVDMDPGLFPLGIDIGAPWAKT